MQVRFRLRSGFGDFDLLGTPRPMHERLTDHNRDQRAASA